MSSGEKICDPQAHFFTIRDSFRPMPGYNLGASDSAHGVFFARSKNETIAVKPYAGENVVRKAKHEAEMLSIAKKAGFLTLNALDVIDREKYGLAYLLTTYRPELTTMSTLVQRQNGTSGVHALVRQTAETLGDLHAHQSGIDGGISHGDAQIKNFGTISGDPRIAVFDFEKGGTEFAGHGKSDPFQHDIESLVQSLAYKSYGGSNPSVAAETVYDNVIIPYVDRIRPVVSNADDRGLMAHDAFLTMQDALIHRGRKVA